MTTIAEVLPPAFAAGAPAASVRGATVGGVALLLRLEGLAALAAALAAYAHLGGSWTLFAALLLAPDLAMLAYLAGPRIGAAAYNLVHTYVTPLALAAAGLALAAPPAVLIALIWAAHIGMDRALGYGLKYSTGFADAHLGRLGRAG